MKNKTLKNLRKSISEGIKNGQISLINKHNTKSISRFISYLNKPKCLNILGRRELDLDNLDYEQELIKSNTDKRQMYSVSVSGSNKNSNNDPSNNSTEPHNEDLVDTPEDTDGDIDTDGDGSLAPPVPTGSVSPVNNVDYELFSTKGSIDLQTLKTDLNIDGLNSNASIDFEQKLAKIKDSVNIALSQVDLSEGVLKAFMSNTKKELEQLTNLANSTRQLNINVNGVKSSFGKNEHFHPKFEDVLFYCKADKNVMLVGEAGTGKTTIAEQVSKALNVDFASYSCTAGMSESQFQGYMSANGEYFETEFLRLYENGGVILLDEFDAIDSNCAVLLNSAMANGIFTVPKRKNAVVAKRHKDCIIIACGNTFGRGASRKYNGRNPIDEATLDRFTMISFEYDLGLERKLVGEHIEAYEFLQELRLRVKENNLGKIVSTRQFAKANRHLSYGSSFTKWAEILVVSWSELEVKKIDFKALVNEFKPKSKK